MVVVVVEHGKQGGATWWLLVLGLVGGKKQNPVGKEANLLGTSFWVVVLGLVVVVVRWDEVGKLGQLGGYKFFFG